MLERTFSFLPGAWYPGDEIKDLLSVASVCHDWREVITSCHALWTNLHVDRMGRLGDCLETIVSHSGSLPLDIKVIVGSCSRPPATAILRVLHRVRTLQLDIVDEEVPLLAASDAPLLQSLSLSTEMDRHEWVYTSEKRLITLPILFNGVHPLLTDLFVADYIRTGPNRFEQLTKLVLHGQHYKDAAEVHSVLDLLEGSSQLADFALTHCSTPSEDGDLTGWRFKPAPRRVPLLQLRRVTFISTFVPLAGALLRCFKLSEDGPITLLLHPSRQNKKVAEPVAMTQLHLLEPFWSEIATTAEKMDVDCSYRTVSFTLVSPRRELRAIEFRATPEQLYAALGVAATRVSDMWIRAVSGTHVHETSMWLMSKAGNAKRVYLDFNNWYTSATSGWDLLGDYVDAQGALPATLEECHLSISPGGEQDLSILKRARGFLASISPRELNSRTFHIYPEQQQNTSRSYVNGAWRIFRAGLINDGVAAARKVEIHEPGSYPKIALSTTFEDDPVHWSWVRIDRLG